MARRLETALALLTLLGWEAAPAPAQAQQPALRIVEARVSSVSGEGVYLDQGRDAHIEPGDRAHVYPSSGPRVSAVIESVSRSGSRARLIDPGGGGSGGLPPEGIAIGDRAEVLVPEARFAAEPAEADPQEGAPTGPAPVPVRPPEVGGAGPEPPPSGPERPVVEHPPWTAPPESWDLETPLLAPPESSTPAERESRIEGRAYVGFDQTVDREGGGGDRTYSLARAGVDARQTNPFGQGGELELDLELFHRLSDTSTGEETDTTLRVDQLSYALGGDREDPRRIEVGRFLQDAFPEFGLVDGVEYQQRTDSGDRFGVSLGLMPVYDETFDSGDDFQGALFYRHDDPGALGADWGLGYQKTWHKGSADRDLLVADGGWRPNDRSWYWGTAFLDYYASGDQKSGVELTELRAGGRWKLSDASGLNADVARILWPDIDRWEYTPITAAQLEDNEVTRANLGGWHQLTGDLRLSARVTWWQDQDDSGNGGELRADWDELFLGDGRLSLTLFRNDAALSRLYGARVGASKTLAGGHLYLGWEAAEHEQEDFSGSQEKLLQHALRGTYDRSLGGDWDLSLSVDERFGDQQDSLSLGFFLQRRF